MTSAPRATLTLALVIGLLTSSPEAQALTGREVMEQADKKNRPKDEVTERAMEILDEKGQVRKREMTTHFKAGVGDDDKILVRFQNPPQVRGVALLTLEQGAGDEQWLYLPENKKTKRIAGASKADSFMGSNFANVDMRTEDLSGHEYKLLGEERVDNRPAHKVEATPKTKEIEEATGYRRRILWVDTERLTVVKVEYWDRKDKPLKVLEASEWKQVQGLWRADKLEVRSQQDKSRTRLLPGKRKINEGLADELFTTRALEKV